MRRLILQPPRTCNCFHLVLAKFCIFDTCIFFAFPSHTRARVAARSLQRSRAGGRSNCALRVPGPEAVPEDNRTEIISPANEQHKIALRAFHGRGEPCGRSRALRAFQKFQVVPVARRAFQIVPGGSRALRAFQMVADGSRAVFYKFRMEEIASAASEYEKPREARKRASLA